MAERRVKFEKGNPKSLLALVSVAPAVGIAKAPLASVSVPPAVATPKSPAASMPVGNYTL